jgi:hypothetical protein
VLHRELGEDRGALRAGLPAVAARLQCRLAMARALRTGLRCGREEGPGMRRAAAAARCAGKRRRAVRGEKTRGRRVLRWPGRRGSICGDDCSGPGAVLRLAPKRTLMNRA